MTLRNWEKRYGMPSPGRDGSGGRRLYSGDDIALVRYLAQRVASGTSIRRAVAAAADNQRDPDRLVQSLLMAAQALDAGGVERSLSAATAALLPADAWSRVLVPALRGLGDRWEAGDDVVAAEHLASSAIAAWLRAVIAGISAGTERPLAAAACGPDEQHELGTMALVALASTRGTPMVYLGANTPHSALEDERRRMGLRVLCITATQPDTADRVVEIMEHLARQPAETTLAYGGPGFEGRGVTHERLVGLGIYLGATIDDAVGRIEQLCAQGEDPAFGGLAQGRTVRQSRQGH
jgi:methanogenic corrinoid protein MtbC1